MTPASLLKQVYKQKVKVNPRYSLRAFARDSGLSPAFLTNFLSGKRSLSYKRAEKIADALALDPTIKRKFLKALLLESSPGKELLNSKETTLVYKDLSLDQFQFFNNWYYVALLDLVSCKGFKPEATWIAERLSISPEQAYAAVQSLLRLGLLRNENGKLKKTDAHINIPTVKNGENVIVAFHTQMIEKAKAQLPNREPEALAQRHISGITIAVDREKIDEAKRKIEAFKLEMAELLSDSEADQVMQLNIQFFPLSKP